MKTLFLLKAGVRLNGARPELLQALLAAFEVWELFKLPELVVTSANDGQHKNGSLHYVGRAVDLRTHNIREQGLDPDIIAAHLRAALGEDYDVLLESPHDANEHIHVEFDPKR